MRVSLAIAATATALALVLTGCSAPQSSPADGASGAPEGDGELTLYVGRDEALVAPLIEKFTEATGIEVTARYASSSELNALLFEEGDNTPAEAFLSQDAGALGSLSNAGLLSKLPADLTSIIPAGFTSANGTWLGITGRARVIAYDSETVDAADVPKAIAALTDPKYAGEVAFAPGNASMQSFVTALRVLDGEDAAEAWVKGMSENSPVLTEKNGETLDLVNSGEVSFGLINHYYWFEDAAELGEDAMRAQLAFLPGDAGGMVNVTGAGILKGSKDDPDALAFLEYLVSEAGQQYFVEQTYEYPLLPGVAAPEGLPALDSLVNPKLDLSDLESLSQTQELLAKYGLL
ncbi:iron ABC transporter substrate-binding protein [Salinibacterium xinjiangense]|uniref:Iron(III) transport system substrate-binding protein n=2 Tax=Salinibacterium xinjiangense TaxID=386302 RepID=A0A2C8YR34_9MICO|nr:iron ABC transporter substrate-binding protein [Salinibacterium xinjiangense]GGK98458.1 iron ABC transporter substrate-binding protein [Salinibacterium xinjiangense]SOE53017.1 iron(III) transport system substrate-binding protein [Salinibacterium xinjiangense]